MALLIALICVLIYKGCDPARPRELVDAGLGGFEMQS